MDETKKDLRKQKTKKTKDKKFGFSVATFVVGRIVLVVGVAFLVIKLFSKPAMADGEYLVSAKAWTLKSADCKEAKDCDSGVVWDFTEIGKGTLTTNNHINDYDFVWALEDGKLLIETKWLYDLDNEYKYELNQNDGVLKLTDGDDTYEFVASFENQ